MSVMVAIANCNSRVKSISRITGRFALFNVKLLFFSFVLFTINVDTFL